MKKMFCRLQVLIDQHNLDVAKSGEGERITQSGLAKKLDLGVSTVRRLYSNSATRVDFNTVNKLCGFFDCEVGDVFGMKEDASND